MANHPFFVYGTLRPGQGNHARLLGGRALAEVPATLPGHALYGPGLPYVAPCDAASSVVGDLIFVAPEHYAEVLADLDRLEGYRPGRPSHYERQARVVRYARDDGAETTAVAWVYLAGPAVRARLHPSERIAGGNWVDGRLTACGQ